MAFRLIPDDTSFDFVKIGKPALCASVLILCVSLLLITFKGVLFSTEFTGGIVVDFQLDKTKEAEEIKSLLANSGPGGLHVQSLGESGKEFSVVFRGALSSEDSEIISQVKDALNTMGNITYKRIDYVGAQVGEEQITRGIVAVLFSLAGMFAYLCFRFRWEFAAGGVLALVHDVLATMGMVSAVGIEFGLPTTAAVLMIIGYSVNDSVVIYDRIRELISGTVAHKSAHSLVNEAINSTLSRTLLTSGTTLLAALPLIFLCEGAVRDLGIVALCGVIVGTYSSIFVAAIPFTNSIQKTLSKKGKKKA